MEGPLIDAEYPCRLEWEQNEESKFICLTLPRIFFEASATSLSQLRRDNNTQRFIIKLVQFIVHALHQNGRHLGTSAGSNRPDFYFKYDSAQGQSSVSFTGDEDGILAFQPKYAVALEFLAMDTMGMQAHDMRPVEEIENLNDIFSDSNCAGIRIFFLIFDPKLNPHKAFQRTIKKNLKYAIRDFIVSSQGITRQKASAIVFGDKKKKQSANNNRDQEDDQDVDDEDSASVVDSIHVESIDPRMAADKLVIDNHKLYYRDVTTPRRFGQLVDFLTRNNVCSKEHALEDMYYDMTKEVPTMNPLHIANWANINHQGWLLCKKGADGSEDEVVVCKEQYDGKNYCTIGPPSTFKFPFPHLTFLLRPEKCSVDNLFEQVFPWKRFSRFSSLYEEIHLDYMREIEDKEREETRRMHEDAILNEKNNGNKVNKYGQTTEDAKRILDISKKKAMYTDRNIVDEWEVPVDEELSRKLESTHALLPEYVELESERERIYVGTALCALKRRMEKRAKQLKEIYVIAPDRYQHAIRMYKEEALAEFVKVYKVTEKENSEAVQTILLWFEREEGIRIYESATRYKRSLCMEINTMDLGLSRSCWSFGIRYIMLDAFMPVASCHDAYGQARDSIFWTYVDPSKAQKDIGTRMKPPLVQLGGPGTSKSFIFELLMELMIKGTLTMMDDMTDKALMTGEAKKLMDVALLVDEMGGSFQRDPAEMNAIELERYRRLKTIFTAQENTYWLCKLDKQNGTRKTDIIHSEMGISMVGCTNVINTGSDQSLNDRCRILVSRHVDRHDRNVARLVGCIQSDKTKRNKGRFILKQQIEQFLFCEICKMQATYVQPVSVNIQVGKILFDHMCMKMKENYPSLDKGVRDVQKLYISFYTQAVLDAIDVCFFSEASPFMDRSLDGTLNFKEFSHQHVQDIMPALCLSEDTAIRIITGWLRTTLHDDVAYDILLTAAQRQERQFGRYKFPPIDMDIPDEVVKIADKELDLDFVRHGPEEDEAKRIKELKKRVQKCHSYIHPVKESGKVYATEEELEDLLEKINYRKLARPKMVSRKETDVNGRVQDVQEKKWETFIDTNFLELQFKTEEEFVKEMGRIMADTKSLTQEVVRHKLNKLKSFVIRSTEVFPIYDKDGNDVTKSHYPKAGSNWYTFNAFSVKTNKATGYGRCYISVHFLRFGGLQHILGRALSSFCHKHTRPRKVIVYDFVDSSPHLFKVANLERRADRVLKVPNPQYMNPTYRESIFSTTHKKSNFSVCNSRRSPYTVYDCDLERQIFLEHAKECGMGENFDNYVPEVVDEMIRNTHASHTCLRQMKKFFYPMSFLHGMDMNRAEFEDLVQGMEKLVQQNKEACGKCEAYEEKGDSSMKLDSLDDSLVQNAKRYRKRTRSKLVDVKVGRKGDELDSDCTYKKHKRHAGTLTSNPTFSTYLDAERTLG